AANRDAARRQAGAEQRRAGEWRERDRGRRRQKRTARARLAIPIVDGEARSCPREDAGTGGALLGCRRHRWGRGASLKSEGETRKRKTKPTSAHRCTSRVRCIGASESERSRRGPSGWRRPCVCKRMNSDGVPRPTATPSRLGSKLKSAKLSRLNANAVL